MIFSKWSDKQHTVYIILHNQDGQTINNEEKNIKHWSTGKSVLKMVVFIAENTLVLDKWELFYS